MIYESTKTTFSKPELSVEDLTIALHQANLRLTDANRRLVESEKKRSELFANISHDLRSPITTLQGYVEYLLTFEHLNEEEVFLTLNQMHNKILSLDYLLNEMFLITSLDVAEERVALRPIQIGRYLLEFFKTCKEDKKYAQRRLSLNIPEDFPYVVLLNLEMFDRVLDNLFTNALKYSSPKDEIILAADLHENEVILSVSDTGIGIDQKYLSLIFERTFMVSDSRTPEQSKGCGLGLSIAASIMEKHNGRIWCASTLRKGSTFYLSLPLYEINELKLN
jgi:signal transduction histidine kinase